MNWLFPRHREAQTPQPGDARSRNDLTQPQDPYRGAALGVECAWPSRAAEAFFLRASPQ